MNDFKKTFIEKFLNGDAEAYARITATDTPEEDEAYLRYGKADTICWRDIDHRLKCHPYNKELSLAYVRYILGYLPQQHAYLPSMPFLQTLTESYETSKVSTRQFAAEAFFHMKDIRNRDMKKGGWVQYKSYTEHDYKHYNTYLGLYKQAARNRLCEFLGYEPDILYSLDAEVFLRQIFENDDFYSNLPYCNADYIAATVVKYREAFIVQGVTAADASDLIGRTIDQFVAFLDEINTETSEQSRTYSLNLLN